MVMEAIERARKKIRVSILRRRIRYIAISALLDMMIMWVAYTTAFSARAVTAGLLDYYRSRIAFMLFAGLLMSVTLYVFGVYHRIWSQTSGHGITSIINAAIVATVVLIVVNMLQTPHPLPVSVIVLGNALALNGFIIIRFRSRLVSGASWRWKAIWNHEFPESKERVLIVGAGEAGQALAWRLKHRFPANNLRIVGFIDDDTKKQGMYVEGCPVLGGSTEIAALAEAHAISLIVVAIHNISGPDLRKILGFCEITSARIKIVPDVFALMSTNQNAPLLRDVEPEDFLGRKPIGRHEAVDLSPVTGKVLMVTGAAGSIGSELSRQLISYNPTALVLLDNNESGLHDLVTRLNALSPGSRLVPVLADITNEDAMAQVFNFHRPQVIFHTAAYKHVPMLELYPGEAVRVNIGGTRLVAELALDYGVERFVLISTDKAVKPTSVMGASKRMCELLMHALSEQSGGRTLYTSVRFGNVLGSRGSVVPTFNRQIDAGGPVTVTHQDMTRYFLTIPEAVNLVIHAASLTQGDDLFMLRMGEVVRIVELAERMIRMRGLRPYQDVDIQFTGMRPGEKLHEQLHTDYENIVETVHPNIVQLVSQANGFDSSLFLEQISALLSRGLNSDVDTLNQLLSIAQSSHLEDVTNVN
ncbi:MAG: polysaccharide biosynthesis protein [Chloroflexi bacterium]|nr:polysaccharide biosynthesis protein [Chloroflexota bacterium]